MCCLHRCEPFPRSCVGHQMGSDGKGVTLVTVATVNQTMPAMSTVKGT